MFQLPRSIKIDLPDGHSHLSSLFQVLDIPTRFWPSGVADEYIPKGINGSVLDYGKVHHETSNSPDQQRNPSLCSTDLRSE